jgi:hypothetical protein
MDQGPPAEKPRWTRRQQVLRWVLEPVPTVLLIVTAKLWMDHERPFYADAYLDELGENRAWAGRKIEILEMSFLLFLLYSSLIAVWFCPRVKPWWRYSYALLAHTAELVVINLMLLVSLLFAALLVFRFLGR